MIDTGVGVAVPRLELDARPPKQEPVPGPGMILPRLPLLKAFEVHAGGISNNA